MSDALRRSLWWLVAGTRGGATRGRIIMLLKQKPMNAKQIADAVSIDYKTVRRHLELLVDNRLLVTAGEKYGQAYFLSPELEANFTYFLEVWRDVTGEKSNIRSLQRTR